MAKNDAVAIQAAKDLVLKMSHIALMKHRGMPQDHIDAVDMAEELVKLSLRFRDLMAEDAAPYLTLPDNVVALRPTAH